MKAPIWGTGRARIYGAAVFATAIFQLAGAVCAADVFNPFSAAARPAQPAQPAPAAQAQPTPQAQPADSSPTPDYYAPSPMQSQPTSMPSDAEVAGPAMTSPAVAAPATAPAASKPRSVGSSSSWSKPLRPIQAAFHQVNGPGAEAQPTPPAVPPTPPGASSVRTDGIQPSTTGPTYVEPAPYSAVGPSGQVYAGPVTQPGGCNCGNGSGPGGPGCGPLPPGQAGCPNCPGWQAGSCSTHNPEGSCILERLACDLCKPYPDCSNGCIDFCHSYIFHEDDCWLFSNHKCCAPWCGPYPYGGCPNDGMGKGVGCGCGNCGPCVPPPDLYFTAEAMILTRDNATDPQTVVLAGATTSALTTGDFNFDWKAGPDLTLGYRPTPKDAWEITYFGLLDWHDVQSRTTTASDLSLPGALGGTLFFNGADTVVSSYTSRINDAEINYLWKPETGSNLMFLAGVRYFNVDERFDTLAESLGNGSSFYNIHTINNLWGAQTGARYHVCGVHWGWEIDGKVGVYGNNATQRQLVGVSGGALTRDAGQNEDNWAFVGQLDATITYNLGRYWELIAGYNVLWVDGLALAPDQLDFTNTPSSGTSLNHNGSLLMHGIHAGIACRW
jgi:hypothetical protein